MVATISLPLFAAWHDWLSSNRALGISLWIGLGVLTVSLFILGRTRWGQAKPLSKCVVLSIFAHILLAAYAYGTKLILEPPRPPLDEAIQITMLSVGEAADQEPLDEPLDQPWNEYVATTAVAPQVTGLAPQAAEPMRIEREATDAIAVPMSADAAVEPTFTTPAAPPPQIASPGLEALRVEQPAAAPAPIEPAATQQREQVAAVGPRASTLPRPSRAPAAAVDPQRDQPALPDPNSDVATRMQQLADALDQGNSADIASAAEDLLAEAVNRDDTDSQRDGAFDRRQPEQASGENGEGTEATETTPPSVSESQEHFAGTDNGAPPVGPPLRLGDGRPLPDAYQARIVSDRLAVAQKHGGNERTEAAVEAALAWLAAAQSDDGRWDASRYESGRESAVLGHNRNGAGAEADTGITGLALLAFLGAGHSHLEGKYRVHVQRGLEFLLRSQREDGSLAGDSKLFAMMYCHGMASLALNEAYAVTGDPRLLPFVERAVAYTLSSQHKSTGGWRYQPGDPGDMSQFGWQVMSLVSAQFAGQEIPELNRGGMVRFIRSAATGRNLGLSGYRPNEHASVTMTAESLLCRLLLRTDIEPAQVDEAIEYLLQDMPSDGKANLYYWYYGTLALFQIQGEPWQHWNERMQEQLIRRQVAEGEQAGSWSPDTMWGGYGGRVYSTALATLCLEVYYRYLPIYGVDHQPSLARRPQTNRTLPPATNPLR